MSQQIKVSRELIFQEGASKTGNIEGRPSYKNQIVFYDDFVTKAIDTSYDYTVAGVNSGTATITTPHAMRLTTGAADNDDIDVALQVGFYGKYNCCLEARFCLGDADKTACNIGFSDETGEAADQIAITVSTGTVTSNASNFAGFVYDAADTNDYLYGFAVNADSDGTLVSSASTPTDTKQYTVRVELIDNGTTCDALYYVNTSGKEIDPANDYIGSELDAVARATALCPYIALINHGESAANTMDVDYIKIWSDRQ